MTYYPKHFKIEELVPKDFYNLHKSDLKRLWYLFDDRALITLDRLRKKYGMIIVNTWQWDEITPFQFRGYRPPDCEIGAKLSQHRFGRAFDCHTADIDVYQIRADITAHPWADEFEFITAIEEGISWLHFDVRNWNKRAAGILRFNPR